VSFRIAVGSRNPVKVACVRAAVEEYWPDAAVEGVAAESGVGHQPRSAEEAYRGALNRARGALASVGGATHGVGLEGGTIEDEHGMWAYAWIVVVGSAGRVGKGQTGRYLLPEGVARLIREEGLELGDADDRFFGRTNSKHNEGAVGILSQGRLDRMQLYKQAVTMALIPFVQPEYY
jgi:inosine/xanthosine triphosphatase